MADFLTISAEWMPIVRLKLGVDSVDLPDASLDNAILIDLAEGRTKSVLTDWVASFEANPSIVKMAAICFLGVHFCDYLEKNVMALEYEGPYRSERQEINWQERKVDLVGEALTWLATIDSSIEVFANPISIVSPTTPLFTEIS